MSTVREQFDAAAAAVKSANEALQQLQGLLGLHAANGTTAPTTHVGGSRTPQWNYDPAKKAKAIAKFRRTMRARARQREQARPTQAEDVQL